MLAKAAEAIRDDVCARFGVTRQEFLYGSQRLTNSAKWPAQYSVSLARATALYELWRAGADCKETGIMLGLCGRAVQRWFEDFRARQNVRAA